MNLVLRNRNGFPLPFAFRRSALDGSFDRLLDGVVDGYFSSANGKGNSVGTAPRINVTESEAAYVVEAEVPGVTKENIKISVDGKHVSLEAEVKREVERKEGEKIIVSERTIKKFSRSFSLAHEVDDERTVAKLENGILILTLPKKEELRPKQIQVQ